MGICSSDFENQLFLQYEKSLEIFKRSPLGKGIAISQQNKEELFKFLYLTIEKQFLTSLTTYHNQINNSLESQKNQKHLIDKIENYSKNIMTFFQKFENYMSQIQQKRNKNNTELENYLKSLKIIRSSIILSGNQQKQSIPRKTMNKKDIQSNTSDFRTIPAQNDHQTYSMPAEAYIEQSFTQSEKSAQKEEQVQFCEDRVFLLEKEVKRLGQQNEKYKQTVARLKQSLELFKINEQKHAFLEQYNQQEFGKIRQQFQSCERQKSELSTENKILSQKLARLSTKSHSTATSLKQDLEIIKTIQYSIQRRQRQKLTDKSKSYIIVDDNQSNKSDEDYHILFNLFPNSKILPTHEEFQSAIGTRTIISQMFSDKIRKAELVYTYDLITPIHYDKYIDGREQLLVLIKLHNGIIIGAYAGRFVENYELSESFLFSISPQRQPIKLITNSRIQRINMENSYLNFGAGDLKIKAKSLNLTCNIGMFQSVYTYGKRTVPVEKFLGGEERTTTMQAFQIYQIEFRDGINDSL